MAPGLLWATTSADSGWNIRRFAWLQWQRARGAPPDSRLNPFRLGSVLNGEPCRASTRERLMQMKKILMTAASIVMLAGNLAQAQPAWVPPGNDPNGYYSDGDRN